VEVGSVLSLVFVLHRSFAMAQASPSVAQNNNLATKVFVGYLSFKTREAELAQAFSVAGRVVNANIITRGPRSLGYGFVEMGSEEEARKAVEAMNKKELDGREINVEVAKAREAEEMAQRGAGAPARGGGAARGGQGAAAGGYPRRPRPPQQAGPNAGGPAVPGAQPANRDYIPRRGRGGGAYRGGAPRGGAPRAPRSDNNGAAQSGPAVPKTSSATTLFVANLPFLVDDKGLEEIFKEFNPVSAHVVKKRNGKSKGFGFVEFKSSDDQQKALTAVDKKEVQARELIVKIALTEQMAAEKKEAAANAAPAPAPAAPAAASPAVAKVSPATDKKN